jgi:hypothetical protein
MITHQGAFDRTAEERNKRSGCSTANDHTRAVIDRRNRKGPTELNVNLKKKIKKKIDCEN